LILINTNFPIGVKAIIHGAPDWSSELIWLKVVV